MGTSWLILMSRHGLESQCIVVSKQRFWCVFFLHWKCNAKEVDKFVSVCLYIIWNLYFSFPAFLQWIWVGKLPVILGEATVQLRTSQKCFQPEFKRFSPLLLMMDNTSISTLFVTPTSPQIFRAFQCRICSLNAHTVTHLFINFDAVCEMLSFPFYIMLYCGHLALLPLSKHFLYLACFCCIQHCPVPDSFMQWWETFKSKHKLSCHPFKAGRFHSIFCL